MHRLRSLRTRLPGVRDFRAGRPTREVEAVYGTERKLRKGRQIHTGRIRQAPKQIVLGSFGLLKRPSIRKKSLLRHDDVSRTSGLPESRYDWRIDTFRNPFLMCYGRTRFVVKIRDNR